jgi:hypothetical protein
MYTQLHGRSDALGANLTFFITQLILARESGLHIKISPKLPAATASPSRTEILDSIFVKTLFDLIKTYNSGLKSEIGEEADVKNYIYDSLLMCCMCVLKTNMDIFSYFKKNFPHARNVLESHAQSAGYTIPYDQSKTILVHLRLGDMRHKPDYDGRLCSEYVVNKINNGQTFREGEIAQPYNHQAPLIQEKLQPVIDFVLKKHPGRKVLLITEPGEDLSSWPYESISNNDESYDMYLLCKAEVSILSRSTFSLLSLFFTEHKDVYVPVWGHTACMGLCTKYQQRFESINFLA